MKKDDDKTQSRALPFDPVIEVDMRDVDRTLIRESLHLSVEECFIKLMRLQEFAEELRCAGKQAKR